MQFPCTWQRTPLAPRKETLRHGRWLQTRVYLPARFLAEFYGERYV